MAYENVAAHSPVTNEQDVTVATQGGQTFNPATGSGAAQFVYVLYKMEGNRTRPTRVLTTDTAPSSWRLGSTIRLYDTAGSGLGTYKIVGVRDVRNSESAGDVPDRNDIKWGVISNVW